MRAKIKGTAKRPRLSVFKSNKNFYIQLINDEEGKTLFSSFGRKTKSSEVGKTLAKKAIKAGIKQVIFDRGGHKFHGAIKSLAEGAREGGLKF